MSFELSVGESREIDLVSINEISYKISSCDIKNFEVRRYAFTGSIGWMEVTEIELYSGSFIFLFNNRVLFEQLINNLSIVKKTSIRLETGKKTKGDHFLKYLISFVAKKTNVQPSRILNRIEFQEMLGLLVKRKVYLKDSYLVKINDEILKKAFVFDKGLKKTKINLTNFVQANKENPQLNELQENKVEICESSSKDITENDIEYPGLEFVYGSSVNNSYLKITPDDKRLTFKITPDDIESCELEKYFLYRALTPINVLEVKLRNNDKYYEDDNRIFFLDDEEHFEGYIKCLSLGQLKDQLSHLGNIEINWFIKYSICYASKKYGISEHELLQKYDLPFDLVYQVNKKILNKCFIFYEKLELVKEKLKSFSNPKELEEILYLTNKDEILRNINEFFERYGVNLEKLDELKKEVFDFTLASDYKESVEGEKLKSFLDGYKLFENHGELNNPISKELLEKLQSIRDDYNVLCNKPYSYQREIMRKKELSKESAELKNHTDINGDVEVNIDSSNLRPNLPHQNNFHRMQGRNQQNINNFERSFSGITHNLSLEEYVSSYKIFIDTCSLLKDDIYNFFEEIHPYLISSGNKIFIPYRCIKELEKHTANNLKPQLSEPAKKILDYLENANNKGLIDIRGDKDDEFADNTFLTVFTKYRLKTNLLLITEDNKLASDINALTQQKSVESDYKIKTADLKSFYPLYKQQPRYKKDFGEIKGWNFDD